MSSSTDVFLPCSFCSYLWSKVNVINIDTGGSRRTVICFRCVFVVSCGEIFLANITLFILSGTRSTSDQALCVSVASLGQTEFCTHVSGHTRRAIFHSCCILMTGGQRKDRSTEWMNDTVRLRWQGSQLVSPSCASLWHTHLMKANLIEMRFVPGELVS